jgi:mannose-6-phosphate isomerase-like protein (cupin superfamily)
METTDYQSVIVRKPWGYEYLMYQNDVLAIWYLHINRGARTSLHCHPNKKTGLIVLSGEVEVSFLQDSVRLKPVDKLIIRAGLFHSTAGLSSEGAVVLEVETPCNKADLVRLDDDYGRELLPYEGRQAMEAKSPECIRLVPPQEGHPRWYDLHECRLYLEKASGVEALRHAQHAAVVVVLEGGLFSPNGAAVLGPGDVVSPKTVARLSRAFTASHGLSVLSIQKGKVEA